MASLQHFARVLLGIALVILGIVGLILPVMPGWIFLIPGLVILADYFPPIRRLVEFLKTRFKDAENAYLSRKQGEAESVPDAHLSSQEADTEEGGRVPASDSEPVP